MGTGEEDGSEQDLVPHMELGADVAANLEVGGGAIRRSVPGEDNLLAGGVVTASELDGIGLRAGERGEARQGLENGAAGEELGGDAAAVMAQDLARGRRPEFKCGTRRMFSVPLSPRRGGGRPCCRTRSHSAAAPHHSASSTFPRDNAASSSTSASEVT